MSDSVWCGFGSMNEPMRREIARKGGVAAHQKGTAHEFSTEEARAAGKKGGESISKDRQHMQEIGRKGGLTTQKRHRQTKTVK